MARLPAFPIDTSGFAQANNLLLRGAENAAQGDAALGAGIGGGLQAMGQGLARGKARREAKQERQEDRAYRQRRDERSDFESNRTFEMRRLEGAAKLLDDDFESAAMDYQMAQFGAQANPAAMLSPEFQDAEARYKDAVARRQSIQTQFQALAQGPTQAPTHRHTPT